MKAGRIFLLIGGLIIALACYAFWPEIGGIMWHLRHGATVGLGDLRIAVPVFYSVNTEPNKNLVYLIVDPNRARRYFKGNSELKFARITFHQFMESKPHLIPIDTKDSWVSHDYIKTLDKAVSLGGYEGRCLGFNGPPLWDGEKDVEIDCEFEGHYQANFSGTKLGSEDFFTILKDVQRFKGRN